MGLLGRIDRFLGRAVMRTFGLVFLAGALAGSYHASREVSLAWQARSWPAVEGQVVASAVEGNAKPAVKYVYEVSGETFEGRLVHAGQFSGLSGYAKDIVARYPKDSRIPIFYDAGDPSRALLEHRVPWVSLLLLVISGCLFWAAYTCFRSKKGMGQILASVDFD